MGKALNTSKKQTNIYKGVFTTCKKRDDEECPAWEIYADEIEHQKEKQKWGKQNLCKSADLFRASCERDQRYSETSIPIFR